MGDKLKVDKPKSLFYIRLFYHSLIFASMPTPTTKNSSQILSMIKESQEESAVMIRTGLIK